MRNQFQSLLLLMYLFFSPLVFAKHTDLLQLKLFKSYLQVSFQGRGREDFNVVSASVKNNISWQQRFRKNKYIRAYERSKNYLKQSFHSDSPRFVFLMPYLESGWKANKGRPSSDYCYWQMIYEVVEEIRYLNESSAALRQANPNEIRTNPKLSTEAALIHLRRYYFYFRHKESFSESDAWLFAMTAFNWGSGNVKALLAEMRGRHGLHSSEINYSNFYHQLYKEVEKAPRDRSMRVALEYIPNLWNIALLIKPDFKGLGEHDAKKLDEHFLEFLIKGK
ncbi:MAG TPA: hypothetical protein EYH35_05050 [Thiotrichaceae bacterium]|nr:hypothetical protein [Thiotrichaceae bacterium]